VTPRSCNEIADLLVDYADSDLPAPESALVTEHLATCERCRATLAALRRSLAAARVVWEAGGAELAGANAGQPGSARRQPFHRPVWRLWRPALVAASVLLLAGGVWFWQRGRPASAPAVATVAPAVAPGPSIADLELEIGRQGISAALLGAAEFLAEQPGGQDVACERFRYVAIGYADSPAGTESKRRVETLCNERKTP
jgi:hypothetical protein